MGQSRTLSSNHHDSQKNGSVGDTKNLVPGKPVPSVTLIKTMAVAPVTVVKSIASSSSTKKIRTISTCANQRFTLFILPSPLCCA